MMWKQLKITAPILECAPRRGLTPITKKWRRSPEQARVRTTTEKEKYNIKVVCFLSLYDALFISV